MLSLPALLVCTVALVSAAPVVESALEARNVTNQQGGPYKRGLCFNVPSHTKLFSDSNSHVSWMYNWDSKVMDAHSRYEFVPMLHSDRPDHVGPWAERMDFWVHVGPGSTHVLSFNEPDQCGNGGSCMQDIPRSIAAHRKYVDPLRSYGNKVRIGSPAVTNGIRDPNTGTVMGLPWLKAFLDGCTGCKIDFVTIHWYDSAKNTQYFKDHVKAAHEMTGRNVWITEFGPSGTEAEIMDFLREVLPWLDQQSFVERYALFYTGKKFLINDPETGLTPIGKLYNTY